MTESSYGIKDLKKHHLQYLYGKYVEHIINLEHHAMRLHNDWVIDKATRDFILQQLDTLNINLSRTYNKNIVSIHKSTDDNNASISIEETTSNDKLNKKLYIDMVTAQRAFCVNDPLDPFVSIQNILVNISREHGTKSLSEFLKLFFNEKYSYLVDHEINELINLYDKVFVPLGAVVNIESKISKKNKSNFSVRNVESVCDSLIDNTCVLTLTFPNIVLHDVPKKTDYLDDDTVEKDSQGKISHIVLEIEGYVCADPLNIYLKASQIYPRFVHQIKVETKKILEENYSNIDSDFLNQYRRLTSCNVYFSHTPKELATLISSQYKLYKDLIHKNINTIMKDFIASDIKDMFNYIHLLVMGSDQYVKIAVLLFQLLKDKKVSSIHISEIIYRNLPYQAQIKLKKSTISIKSEISRIRSLTPESISTEKKLASMVNMPDNVKAYITEKLNEIKTGESNYKLQMAVNGLMQFPWKPKDSKSDFSDIRKSMIKSRDYLQNVANKLNKSVYGHENSKKILIELVGKWIQNPESTGQVIGLVGPPGVGKTLLAKSISVALGVPLAIVGLGGMSDSADLIGHSFTYSGAQYGMIVRQMIKAGNWRCVMFFDEVDKVSKRNDTNEIYNTLIHITDPNMNQHFQDRFYSSSIEFDLSGVLIVFSYNNSDRLDPILLDRIKEIKINSYSTKEKVSIAQNYILKELCDNIGFDKSKIHFDDAVIRYIIEKYTQEAGARELRRKLEQILLKLNIDRFYMRGPFRKIMYEKYVEQKSLVSKLSYSCDLIEESPECSKESICSYVEYKKTKLEDAISVEDLDKIFNLEFDGQITITENLIHRYLEKPTLTIEAIHKTDLIGVINGLYATSGGTGGIVPIQIYKNYIGTQGTDDTNFRMKLTGNQKQVMRESVICALTTAINVLNKQTRNAIMTDFPYGFHIHAPDGGTPKDGPSAGCAFTTAFVSILLNKKINRYVAMTGEIELTGKVSKIGGLDAKLTGAKKAGIKRVYICDENKEDYEQIKKKSPELFDDTFQVKIINHIIDIVTDPYVILDIQPSDFDTDVISDHQQRSNTENRI